MVAYHVPFSITRLLDMSSRKLTKEVLGCPSIMQLLICLALCSSADNEIYHFQNSIYTQSLCDQIPADIVVSDTHGAMPMI